MKSALYLSICSLLCFPAFVSASTGFAQESVWISRTPVVEGQTVQIHAALGNGSGEKLTGTMVFKDGEKIVGSLPITLNPNEARVVSVSWTPGPGSHAITAEIQNASIPTESPKETLRISVEEKPAPAPTETAAVADAAELLSGTFSDSSFIQTAVESLSPTVADVVAPALSVVDDVRLTGVDLLSEHIEKTKGTVAGVTTQRKELIETGTPEAQKESRKLGLTQMLHTILLYLYETLRTIVAKAVLFYPLFAGLFLLGLYKLYQRIRRPTYDY